MSEVLASTLIPYIGAIESPSYTVDTNPELFVVTVSVPSTPGVVIPPPVVVPPVVPPVETFKALTLALVIGPK